MAPSRLLGGRYRLDELIAAGGMGEVWRATDLILQRAVAVKLLRPEYVHYEDGLARFRAEARHGSAVSHPCIAQVYDYGEDDPRGQPYLVMELVDGPSLARLLTHGPLSVARTLWIVAQAARGLAAAHAAGLVHRDIKPGNLLVSRQGHVKITDFGISHVAGSEPVTQTGSMICTPAYLAPERAAGASATPAADLYSLGVVAYHCLAGRLPFTGEPIAVALAHREKPLPPLPAKVPPPVAALVASLTAKDPLERPAGASAVAAWAGQLYASLFGAGRTARAGVRPAASLLPTAAALAPTRLAPVRTGPAPPRTGPALARTGPAVRPAAAEPVTSAARPAAATGQPAGTARRPAAAVGQPTAASARFPAQPSPGGGRNRPWPGHPRPAHTVQPARAVLALAVVAAIGLGGWMAASQPGPAGHRPPAAPPLAARHSSHHGHAKPLAHRRGPHFVAIAGDADQAGGAAAGPSTRGKHHKDGAHPSRRRTPRSSPTPSPTPPTPTPSPTPSGTPSSSPSPSGTPTPPAGSSPPAPV
jgi:serine/threonine-protein kinase